MAALASLDAAAADWRQYISQPAVDYFFDGDSVKRTPGAFEVVIRLREKPGEDMATRVAVDCNAATFRKLDVGLVEGERYVAKSAEAGGVLPVGKGFVLPLFQGWCIAWSEPAGAVWQELGKSASTTLYLDETPFKRNGDFERGIETDFTATVKSVGGGVENLQRLRIDCRAGRYEPLGGLERQAGVVSRIVPGPAAAIQNGTQPDMLKSRLCRQDVAERQSQQAERRRAAEAEREQAERAQRNAGACAQVAEQVRGHIREVERWQSSIKPLCRQLDRAAREISDTASESSRLGCNIQINDGPITSLIGNLRGIDCND